jgi:hypothetical protein
MKFILRNSSETEFFIIENRTPKNRDTSLPSSGLAIWHVDERGNNEYQDMTSKKHYECSLEQADGRNDLEKAVNIGNVGDLYNKNNSSKFGDSTKPNSRWWDGSHSGLEIIDIGNEGKEITFSIKK